MVRGGMSMFKCCEKFWHKIESVEAPIDLLKKQNLHFKKGAAMPIFDIMMYYVSLAP